MRRFNRRLFFGCGFLRRFFVDLRNLGLLHFLRAEVVLKLVLENILVDGVVRGLLGWRGVIRGEFRGFLLLVGVDDRIAELDAVSSPSCLGIRNYALWGAYRRDRPSRSDTSPLCRL